MKRSWIGLGMLLVLLGLGLLITWGMGRIHDPIEKELEQAAAYALQENWMQADRVSQTAKAEWERWEHLRTMFADHTPLEEIDAGFAALQVYSAAREEVAFAAACAELAKKVAAVGEAHGLRWRNIL